MNILFFKKFGGNSERERIIIFVMDLSTKWIGAIKTSIYIYVSPVITVILSVLILHEKITVISIIGTILILIGLVSHKKLRQQTRLDV
mgnify:CR=1 FL=1